MSGSADFDCDTFIDYVQRQTIGGTIYHIAQCRSVLQMLPERCVEWLRKSFLSQHRWNLLLLARVAEINATMRAAGREVIVLKGLPSAQEYYGQLAARQIGDLDLLIENPADLFEFEQILARLGYRRRSRILGSRALMARYTHHVEFEGLPAPLDLHWVLRRHPSLRVDYSDLWRRKRRVSVRKVEFLVPPIEYELILQFLSLQNDIQLGVHRLKAFIDLYAMLKRVAGSLDWDSFFHDRQTEGMLGISVNVLDLVLEVLECRQEFPTLAQPLESHRKRLVLSDFASKAALLGGSGELHRRMWALRLYDISAIRALWWWGLSLPFRLAEHR
ncbi:MAG TPA: nucleotidyltransferase family protein [Candidatus Binataceae bacterium]|nr:nucleotidyltransferase family protein [Candidatus Binataceae bacterium]